MEFEEALIQGVYDGKLTASLEGHILSPEEHEFILIDDPQCAAEIVYTVPN